MSETMNFNMKWSRRFMGLAALIASWSKDPSTKCGAVIARPDRTVASLGFNGFPRGMNDDEVLYSDRSEKYPRVIHAEMNAILTAKEPLNGFSLFVFPIFCCDRCAVHIIQSGIREIYTPVNAQRPDLSPRARDMFREAGLRLSEVAVP